MSLKKRNAMKTSNSTGTNQCVAYIDYRIETSTCAPAAFQKPINELQTKPRTATFPTSLHWSRYFSMLTVRNNVCFQLLGAKAIVENATRWCDKCHIMQQLVQQPRRDKFSISVNCTCDKVIIIGCFVILDENIIIIIFTLNTFEGSLHSSVRFRIGFLNWPLTQNCIGSMDDHTYIH